MRKQVSIKFGLFTVVFAFVKSWYLSTNDGFKTAINSFDQVKSHFFYFREGNQLIDKLALLCCLTGIVRMLSAEAYCCLKLGISVDL